MADKNFAAWNPNPNPKRWSHPQFTEFNKFSKRQAFEFRWETNGDPVPANLLTEDEKRSQESVNVPTAPESFANPSASIVDKVEAPEASEDEIVTVEKKKPGRKPKAQAE